jgi:hypothetical protein
MVVNIQHSKVAAVRNRLLTRSHLTSRLGARRLYIPEILAKLMRIHMKVRLLFRVLTSGIESLSTQNESSGGGGST